MADERIYKAILVGNSTYVEDRFNLHNLNGPVNDVEAMKRALTDPTFGLHDHDNILTLIDRDKASVEATLESFFAEAGPLDQLLFYYSGHSWQDVNRFYFCTSDSRTDRPLSTAVPGETVSAMMDSSNAAAIAVILDCCSSGGFKGDVSLAVHGRGRWTLASSRWNQASKDAVSDSELSAFTSVVAEGLVGGDAVDVNRDGFVSIGELHQYVHPLVRKLTGQIPHYHVEGSGELAVALAPAPPSRAATDRARRGDRAIAVLPIPRQAPAVDLGSDTGTSSGNLQFSWRLEESKFLQSAVALLDENRSVPLRLALQEAVRDARRLVGNAEDWATLGRLLDRMTALAATSLNLEREDWFKKSVSSFVQVYEAGFDPYGIARRRPEGVPAVRAEELWLAVFERLIALGGLAVREKCWASIRDLVLQRPEGHDFRYWTNWIRHALTQAARANLFRYEDGGTMKEKSVINMTCDYVMQHDFVRPDVENRETVLNSLCQFDFLACVVTASAFGNEGGRHFYTNFARFGSDRVLPAARLLVVDLGMRGALLPDVDDKTLAKALLDIHNMAYNEGFRYEGWYGYEDPVVLSFVNDNISATERPA